jgi:hypothetical protein
MGTHITVMLPDIPKYLRLEYHPDQVELYSKFTELTFKSLKLPSVVEFMESLASTLKLEKLGVLVMRLPARRSRINFVEKEGKIRFVGEELHGGAVKKRDLILVWPDLIWPNKKAKPWGMVGIRGFILNVTIRAVIHEMLHKSGVKDEDEVRKLTDEHFKSFRRTYLSRFEAEFNSLVKQWKRIEKAMGLR